MKFYSEVLGEIFDTEEDLKNSENEFLENQRKAQEEEKRLKEAYEADINAVKSIDKKIKSLTEERARINARINNKYRELDKDKSLESKETLTLNDILDIIFH